MIDLRTIIEITIMIVNALLIPTLIATIKWMLNIERRLIIIETRRDQSLEGHQQRIDDDNAAQMARLAKHFKT